MRVDQEPVASLASSNEPTAGLFRAVVNSSTTTRVATGARTLNTAPVAVRLAPNGLASASGSTPRTSSGSSAPEEGGPQAAANARRSESSRVEDREEGSLDIPGLHSSIRAK